MASRDHSSPTLGHASGTDAVDQHAHGPETRRMADALRVSEQRLRTAIAASPVAVFNQDLDLRYTWVLNPTPGPYQGTVVGKTDREILERPEDAEEMHRIKRRVIESGRGTRRQLTATVAGSVRQFDATLEPLHGPDGEVVGLTGAVLDVTEHSRRDEAIQQQAEALAEVDRRKDEFIAMLGHELRSPMAPIRNALEALRLRREAADEPVERELQVIGRQLDHLTRLVDDLLDVARITRGRVELRRELVDVRTVVELALETVEPELRKGRQHVDFSAPDEPLSLYGDPVRLAQVLSNLLSNASKYSDPGSTIEVEAAREADELRLRVRDDGVGMASGQLDSVFEHFYQTDSSLDRSRGGLGLGLTLVKALTELHGGSVEAASDGLGTGCTFTVRLPLAPLAAPETEEAMARGSAAAPEEERKEVSSAPRRVLVVDDSADTARSFAELLELKGHRVRVAHDGQAAIEACRSFRPRVVFLDIGLPEMSGYDVARTIRRETEERSEPQPTLIAVTGYGQEESRRRGRQAGFDQYLLKPIDLQEVLEVLDQADS